MPNTTTTPASVASRLTDEKIESIAKSLEYDAENLYGDNTRSFMDDENNAAAVLRDYVLLRKLNGKLKECLNQAYGDKMNTYRMTGNEVQNWGIVLAAVEKGETK